MLITRTAGLILVAALFCPPHWTLAAGQDHHPKSNADPEIQLSPDLKALLNQEMAAIEKGMMDLIPAISAGEWDTAASIGKNIKDSFIMKQKLTKLQKDELHRELPPGFIEMDQEFHKSAGMLAHAAEMKNADVVNFYFFKLNNACVACHGKFAAERFPGLVKGAGKEGSHH
jgi:hypothetical protein